MHAMQKRSKSNSHIGGALLSLGRSNIELGENGYIPYRSPSIYVIPWRDHWEELKCRCYNLVRRWKIEEQCISLFRKKTTIYTLSKFQREILKVLIEIVSELRVCTSMWNIICMYYMVKLLINWSFPQKQL